VEIISLTPRFNAVNHERAQEKPFKRFFSSRAFHTRLKPGVNEKLSTKYALHRQRLILAQQCLRPNESGGQPPQSRRFAPVEIIWQSRSVWTAVALAPLFGKVGE
jgi:hypothetical protein